jgi:hypothetical protein
MQSTTAARKCSHGQTFLNRERSSKWSGVRTGTHLATRLSITPRCLVQCMPRRSLARLSLARFALSRFVRRPSSVPKQKVFMKLLSNEFKFCCINACGDTHSLEYAKNASDRLKGTSVAAAFSKQWRSCVVLSCRIGSSLARYFLVKQGLSASRLTLCDSKVTHAPTVSPRGVSAPLVSWVSRAIRPYVPLHDVLARYPRVCCRSTLCLIEQGIDSDFLGSREGC